MILIPLCIYLSIKNTNIDKKYIPPKFDGEKIIPGYFDEKKIKKFDLACKAIDIPINEIRIIENCIKHKKGKIYIVGGAVRN